MGIDGKEALQLVVCNQWRTYEWRALKRILVVQIGTNEDEAKVFRAHAIPEGLCENLINALKLLANQQTDGDIPDLKQHYGPGREM